MSRYEKSRQYQYDDRTTTPTATVYGNAGLCDRAASRPWGSAMRAPASVFEAPAVILQLAFMTEGEPRQARDQEWRMSEFVLIASALPSR